jgi:hypothetical protein
MSGTYDNKRVDFAIIEKKYKDYIALYRAINNGSVHGLTPFDEFYWHYTYYHKYVTGRITDNRTY